MIYIRVYRQIDCLNCIKYNKNFDIIIEFYYIYIRVYEANNKQILGKGKRGSYEKRKK